jgi:general secretion pathway protein M
MKEWWNNLVLRERQMVSLGAMIISLLFIYFFLWSPLDSTVTSLRSQIRHNQELLAWMQDADKRIQLLQKTARPAPVKQASGSLLSILQKQINGTAFVSALSQLHQVENNSVQLAFQKINFDALVGWLIKLNQQGIQITQMTVAPSDVPGIVGVELVLKL